MTDFIVNLIAQGGYWAIALLMALENIFPPIPSEIIMGLGGIEAGQGDLNFWGVIAAGTTGSVIGNMVWFEAGRRLGAARLQQFVDRWGRWLTLDRDEIERLNGFFRRHGPMVVLFARLLPTVRTLVSLPAGVFRMGRMRFVSWTALGVTAWNLVIAGLGYQLGARVTEIDQITGPLSTGIIAVILIAYVWRVVVWKRE